VRAPSVQGSAPTWLSRIARGFARRRWYSTSRPCWVNREPVATLRFAGWGPQGPGKLTGHSHVLDGPRLEACRVRCVAIRACASSVPGTMGDGRWAVGGGQTWRRRLALVRGWLAEAFLLPGRQQQTAVVAITSARFRGEREKCLVFRMHLTGHKRLGVPSQIDVWIVSGHIAPSVPFLSGAMAVSGLGLAQE
jgi:hypothetical protein